MHKTLIVTNDFPPRPGGIQAFLHNMALRLDPERLVVYASTWKHTREGAEATAAFDAEQPFTVVRDRTTMLLPTPAVTRRAVGLLREHGCTSVWFGAAAPLQAQERRDRDAKPGYIAGQGLRGGPVQLEGAHHLAPVFQRGDDGALERVRAARLIAGEDLGVGHGHGLAGVDDLFGRSGQDRAALPVPVIRVSVIP